MKKLRNEIIATGLRSDTVLTQGKKCITIKKIQKGKKVTRKKVLEISEKQAKNYKLIGKAEGMNLFHCVYLASKDSLNFKDQVAAYVIVEPTKGCNFAVAFYEKKKREKNKKVS